MAAPSIILLMKCLSWARCQVYLPHLPPSAILLLWLQSVASHRVQDLWETFLKLGADKSKIRTIPDLSEVKIRPRDRAIRLIVFILAENIVGDVLFHNDPTTWIQMCGDALEVLHELVVANLPHAPLIPDEIVTRFRRPIFEAAVVDLPHVGLRCQRRCELCDRLDNIDCESNVAQKTFCDPSNARTRVCHALQLAFAWGKFSRCATQLGEEVGRSLQINTADFGMSSYKRVTGRVVSKDLVKRPFPAATENLPSTPSSLAGCEDQYAMAASWLICASALLLAVSVFTTVSSTSVSMSMLVFFVRCFFGRRIRSVGALLLLVSQVRSPCAPN